MNQRQARHLIVGTVIAFASWELIGHWFLMAVPMGARHALDLITGTTLALLIAMVSIWTIERQQKDLYALARVRDYLLRMQAHSLLLPPSARKDPQQQLAYQAMELRFADIQPRLVSTVPHTRASGMLDLGELARIPEPGGEESYPFFPRAVSHLTAALYLEAERAPRDEALHTLEVLAAFARDHAPTMLAQLINDLAHANRTACNTLIDALATRFAPLEQITDTELTPILPLLRLTDSQERDASLLRDLLASARCQETFAAYRSLQIESGTPNADEQRTLQAIGVAAINLKDCRDALAQALRTLPHPEDFPTDPAKYRYWKRPQPLSLQSCFLVNADLRKAQLQNANLQQAWLQGANATDVQLQNADLTEANLRQTQLMVADLRDARLPKANLQDATLTIAFLQGADLSETHLQGAHLVGAHLEGTCLWKATIADDKIKRIHCPDFKDANWWDACFIDPLTGDEDVPIQTWLRFTFPQPPPESASDADRSTEKQLQDRV